MIVFWRLFLAYFLTDFVFYFEPPSPASPVLPPKGRIKSSPPAEESPQGEVSFKNSHSRNDTPPKRGIKINHQKTGGRGVQKSYR